MQSHALMITLLLTLMPAAVFANEAAAGCPEFVTEFIDISALGRKNSAAKKMTERANERAADGWRQIDMEIYTENGDLEGFFMVFERTESCVPSMQE